MKPWYYSIRCNASVWVDGDGVNWDWPALCVIIFLPVILDDASVAFNLYPLPSLGLAAVNVLVLAVWYPLWFIACDGRVQGSGGCALGWCRYSQVLWLSFLPGKGDCYDTAITPCVLNLYPALCSATWALLHGMCLSHRQDGSGFQTAKKLSCYCFPRTLSLLGVPGCFSQHLALYFFLPPYLTHLYGMKLRPPANPRHQLASHVSDSPWKQVFLVLFKP